MDPPPQPPDYVVTTVYSQYFFSFCLAFAGFCHLASHGVLAKLYTGIYVGVFVAVATYFEKWILNRTSTTGVTYSQNQLRACQGVTVIALLLCAINVPLVALFSVAYGDAFGRPPNDEQAPYCFFCYEYGQQGANVPALISDVGLLLFGMIASLLLCGSGSYFWTVNDDGSWLINRVKYLRMKMNRS